MWLMYIKNNEGPRIDPCGTLHDMLETLEKEFSKFTINLRLDREDCNHLTVWSEKPIILNFFSPTKVCGVTSLSWPHYHYLIIILP